MDRRFEVHAAGPQVGSEAKEFWAAPSRDEALSLANSDDPFERCAAVFQLAEMTDPRAAVALRELMNDGDEIVAEAARAWIGQLAGPPVRKRGRPTASVPSSDRVDSEALYLAQIRKVPLLPHHKVVELKHTMDEGVRARGKRSRLSCGGGEQTSLSEIRRLEQMRAAGLHARKLLIESNLRLVFSIARHYQYSGVPLLDLIQEGSIGLMRAVERFDVSLGNRFSTYATWLIRQSVTRAIANSGRIIRLPVHVVERVNAMKRAALELEANGWVADTQALAAHLEISCTEVEWLRDGLDDAESLDALLMSDLVDGQLDPCEDEGDPIEWSLGIYRHDDEVFESVRGGCLKRDIAKVLDSLPRRDRMIIEMRFGIKDDLERTLEQVSDVFGVTRERIRQIESKALHRLRAPKSSCILRDYLN